MWFGIFNAFQGLCSIMETYSLWLKRDTVSSLIFLSLQLLSVVCLRVQVCMHAHSDKHAHAHKHNMHVELGRHLKESVLSTTSIQKNQTEVIRSGSKALSQLTCLADPNISFLALDPAEGFQRVQFVFGDPALQFMSSFSSYIFPFMTTQLILISRPLLLLNLLYRLFSILCLTEHGTTGNPKLGPLKHLGPQI